MSTVPASRVPDDTEFPEAQRPWCTQCASSENLIIETIEPLQPPVPEAVAIEYSCAECDYFYAHPATVQHVAELLNETETTAGVLRFGHHFIHCGEPMQEIDLRPAQLEAPGSTADMPPVEVFLPTRTLACRCGFRLAIPK